MANEGEVRCASCGHLHPTPVDICVVCGSDMARPPTQTAKQANHPALLKSEKTQWVAAVIAFWISIGVLAVVFVIQGRLSLVLVSICLGLMILGIGLKVRYQLHLRKHKNNP